MTIDIHDHAVVIAIGGKRAPFAEVLDRIPATAVPWDVNKPDASGEALRAALKETGRVRVAMQRAHGPAVRDTIAIAHKHGARAVLLRLPDSPDVSSGTAKLDTSYDLVDATAMQVRIVPMPSNRKDLKGPFDIIGDIHGTTGELLELLGLLGHLDADGRPRLHPEGRVAVFLGDYTDRGPRNREALEVVRAMTMLGNLAIMGNHDAKILRWLQGKTIEIKAGVDVTVAELEATTPEWRAEMAQWLEGLQTHYVLDGGALVVAHAGLSDDLHGRHTSGARSMALYGKPLKGGTVMDEDGYPLAEDWAQEYAGEATVVHGHVIHPEPRLVNNVVAIDTAAVFGGSLTAYQWPERTFVQVQAHETYFVRHGRTIEGEDA